MTDEQRPEGGMPDPAGSEPAPAAPPPLAPLAAPAPAAAPAPQPAVAWAPPPAPVVAGPGQRTVLALVAGIVMVLGAIFFGLIGLAVAVLGPTFINSMGDLGTIPGFDGDPGSLIGGMMAIVGIILLLFALAYFVGGIGIIRNRGWGRVIGLTLGILGGLIWLTGVTAPEQAGGSSTMGSSLFFFGIHAYIVVVLLFFWRSKPASA